MQKRKRREKDDKDDAVSLCSFDFKVRKPPKQNPFCKARYGTTDLSKYTNQITSWSQSVNSMPQTNIKKDQKKPHIVSKIKAILHKNPRWNHLFVAEIKAI